MAQQTVTLNPGQSKLVSFETVPQVAKTYLVNVDGLTGSFVAMEAPPVPKGREFIGLGIGPHYINDFNPTRVRGKLATISISQTKPGMAGIEQDVEILVHTDVYPYFDVYFMEAVNWYYDVGKYKWGEGGYQVGLVGYHGSTLILNKKADSIPGQAYSYLISLENDEVRGQIWDESGNLLLDGSFPCPCADVYDFRISTWIEYWRWYSDIVGGQWIWLPGEFHQKSVHRVEELYDPNVGWKAPKECCEYLGDDYWNQHPYALNILHIHESWIGGIYRDSDCEVNDVV